MEAETFEVAVGGTLPDGSDGTAVRFELTYGHTADGTGLVHARVAPSAASTMGVLCAATRDAATPLFVPSDASEDDVEDATAAALRVVRATGVAQLFLAGADLLQHTEKGGTGVSLVAVTAERVLIAHIKEHYEKQSQQRHP